MIEELTYEQFSKNDNNGNYNCLTDYVNDLKIVEDFTEEDFKIVMEIFQSSGYIRTSHVKRYDYKIIKDFNNNLTIQEIAQKYDIEEDDILNVIDRYLLCLEELDIVSIYKLIIENYAYAVKNKDEKTEIIKSYIDLMPIDQIAKKYNIRKEITEIIVSIFNKFGESIIPDVIIDALSTEYRKLLNWNIRRAAIKENIELDLAARHSIPEITEKFRIEIGHFLGIASDDIETFKYDIFEYIDDSTLNKYIIASFNLEKSDEKVMEKITKKFQISEKKYCEVITNQVIWYKLKDDYRRNPNLTYHQLSKKYEISPKLVSECLKLDEPPKIRKKKYCEKKDSNINN
jgi:hypothetical protein